MGQYLLKFFEKKEHQKDFLDGKLYMKTLKSFKEYEKSDFNRSDKFEAIVKHNHVHYDAIQIEDLVILKEEISPSHETTNTRKYDYCNIFCMYALWPEKEEETLIIDDKNKEFGDFCVCIVNPKEFIERVVQKTREQKIACHCMKVKYINKSLFNGQIKDLEVPFTKFDHFDYQKEFRIAIDRKKNVDEHYSLDIGDIRDIAFVTSIDKINSSLQK